MSYSTTTLIGNLGKKPETKTLDSGNTVTRLSLATSRTWRDKDGNKQEDTQWHNVVLWNKMGELAQQYLAKGSKVLIVGRLEYRTYEYEGTKHYYTDIVASEMKFLDSRKSNDNRFPSDEHAPMVASTQAATDSSEPEGNLPF
jgi:single-strand DNA-binding protein